VEYQEKSNIQLSSLQQNLPKILIGAVFAVALVMLVFLAFTIIPSLFPPNFKASSPVDGATGVSPFNPVLITFDRNISSDNANKLKFDPDVKGTAVVSVSVVKFTPETSFEPGKKYAVTLVDPDSPLGVKGESVTFSFTTKTIDQFNAQEKAELQKIADVQFAKGVQNASNTTEYKKAMALLNLKQSLPYDTDQFSISYIESTDNVVIYIKDNPYDVNKRKALDWLKSVGIEDLNWINLLYTSAKGVVPVP